jgi:hypothetical protein
LIAAGGISEMRHNRTDEPIVSNVDGQSASSATKWTFNGRSNQTFCLETSGCVEDTF